ncbi:cytochrome P450 2D15-like isoform X2 [Anomaloglossus baeobatrachus]|uniref:cytochrome P450 2D15-like isoform X2 n=1 Tax=Anomaloglossus baeobatrachus TaxID=238106 RepID=UPI003F505D10
MQLLNFCSYLLGFFSNVFSLGVILAISLLFLDFMKRRKRWDRYPPGPPSIPFVGNIFQVDFSNIHNNFRELTKQYGDVFSLQYFWQNMVVLNGFEVMKEALMQKSEDIADRPRFPLFESLGITGNSKGVSLAHYGRAWQEQRRFSLTTLRDFGMGKKSLETRVSEEAEFLCAEFQSLKGKPFDPHFLLNTAVSNIISSIVFGDRFEYDDGKFNKLLRVFEDALKAESGFFAQAKGDKDSSFNEKSLVVTTIDLFTAGIETTTTTSRWALLFMILYPEVQRRVHKEIDEVIGRNRKPTMADVLSMPYTNAVIHEVQRCGDIFPVAAYHMSYRNTEIGGYFIPKGTIVVTNLSSVLKDDRVWKKPLQFYPEHFMDVDGKFVKHEAFIPFSAGRRACPGEHLARMELFLFFTTLLQSFTFQIPDKMPRPQESPVLAVTLCPQPFTLCAIAR